MKYPDYREVEREIAEERNPPPVPKGERFREMRTGMQFETTGGWRYIAGLFCDDYARRDCAHEAIETIQCMDEKELLEWRSEIFDLCIDIPLMNFTPWEFRRWAQNAWRAWRDGKVSK